MLTCSTNLSFIVDSIEILDSNGQIIAGPSRNVSFVYHTLNGSEAMKSEYICRVNSTLGGQNQSVYITNEFESNQRDYVTTMTTMITPGIVLYYYDVIQVLLNTLRE